ncbi:MAG TPA: fibro-slime domain-containing protein, partial [Polyangia bacterium]
TLTLPQVVGMTGVYQFDSTAFFPIDNKGWGNGPNNHNFGFTSAVRYWFEYNGAATLDFVGDDDVWVFIDKQLAVDLGGLHSRLEGFAVLDAANGSASVCDLVNGCAMNPGNAGLRHTVNLGLQLGSVYEIVVFQAERHTTASNYRLTLSNFTGTRSVCTSVCGDGIVTSGESCDLGTANNTGAYGTCNANCTLAPYCGDSIVQASNEQCDNGLNVTTYGGTAKVCGPGCKWAGYCGDGNVDAGNGEQCDDAANNGKGYGFCTTNCQLGPRCGDGVVTNGEQCDSGATNGAATDKCQSNCMLKCGNGTLEAGEQCDNGAANNTGGYGKCNADCTLGARCGDGIKNGTEQCDDGKNDGSYGNCAPGCVLGPRCGDSLVQTGAGETCDSGANNQPVATAYGKTVCTTRCLAAPYCGNKSVDTAFGEGCDDGVNSGLPGSCTTDCKSYVPLASCGNGVKDTGEQCDDGANNGTMASTCDVHCKLKCGDGVKDPGEQCDDGTNSGAYGTCNANCTLAPYCGDGAKNGPEQCDNGAGNSDTGYGPGTCTKQCKTGPYCGDGRIQAANGEECDSTPGCDGLCHNKVVP